MSIPYLTLPAFPGVSPGTSAVTVKKNTTLTLASGAFGRVTVENGATLILTGGLYQMRSLDVGNKATVLFRGATEIRIDDELGTEAKARLILDHSVPGLTAAHMKIFVAGDNDRCQHGNADGDDDHEGPASVHIGTENIVQANVVAARGTVWLKAKTQATGSFIGVHVRIGHDVTLTLASAFQ